MKKFSPFILYILFFASFSAGFTQDIEPKRATIQETLVIGTSDSNPDYLFGDLSYADLALDEDRNIYVPDNVEMSIKVYDKDGTFVRRIGRRGRGPGEFIHFTSITYDEKQKQLLVLDYMSQRASFFDTDGNLKQTVKLDPKNIHWPRKVVPYQNGYLVLAKSRNNKGLFSIFDNQFKTKEAEFGQISKFLYSNYFGEESHYGFDPGSITAKDSEIYYAPPFYKGFIYQIRENKDINRIEGHIYKKKPYTVLNINQEKYKQTDKPKPYHINGSIRGQKFTMLLHNYHRGIFMTNNGKLVNFTMIENEETRDFGVEIYQTNPTKLLNYYLLESVPLEENVAVNVSKFPKAIDSENNFYMIEYGDKHLVKRFRLNLPELQQ